ncbi:MAG: hypothetical protein R8P61_24470 [Bacteroidia bacterium]|nr:hypothetical protein [Bacteroidia bacterium]
MKSKVAALAFLSTLFLATFLGVAQINTAKEKSDIRQQALQQTQQELPIEERAPSALP